ncbi:hypothetical protein D3C72_1939030 [compost metagenome]
MMSGSPEFLRRVVADVVGSRRATGPSLPLAFMASSTLPRRAMTASSSSLVQVATAFSSL